MFINTISLRKVFVKFWLILLSCLLINIILFTGCTIKRKPLLTYYDNIGFSNIFDTKKTMCVISFSADSILYDSRGDAFDINPGFLGDREILKKMSPELTDSLTNKVKRITAHLSSKYLENVLSVFSERFQIVGSTNYEDVKTPLADSLQMIKLIRDNDAEYGLRMHNQYGAEWQSGNTGIEAYYFQFITAIYNREGQIVWMFCGKGSQKFKVDFSLRGLTEGFAGTISSESIVKGFKHIFAYYPQLALHLIEDDALEKEHRSNITDYIEIKKFSEYFDVYNCSDEFIYPKYPILISYPVKVQPRQDETTEDKI